MRFCLFSWFQRIWRLRLGQRSSTSSSSGQDFLEGYLFPCRLPWPLRITAVFRVSMRSKAWRQVQQSLVSMAPGRGLLVPCVCVCRERAFHDHRVSSLGYPPCSETTDEICFDSKVTGLKSEACIFARGCLRSAVRVTQRTKLMGNNPPLTPCGRRQARYTAEPWI